MEDADPTIEQAALELQELMDAAQRQHMWRCQQPFNGVLGLPPDWFPKWALERFVSLRDKLMLTTQELLTTDLPTDWKEADAVVAAKVEEWLGNWRLRINGNDGEKPFVPDQIWGDIDLLGHYFAAAKKSKTDGLKLLGGSEAVAERAAHEAAKTRNEKLAGEVQPRGVKTRQDRAAQKTKELDKAIDDYLQRPEHLLKSNKEIANFIHTRLRQRDPKQYGFEHILSVVKRKAAAAREAAKST